VATRYDAKVRALSIVQGPFPVVAPCQTSADVPIRNFLIASDASTCGRSERARAARVGERSSSNGTVPKVVKQSAVVITVMSLVWYAGNIYFNILNKQVLKAFMFPFTCTCIYLGVCGLVGVAGWATGLLEKPKLTQKQIVAFIPMAVLHLLGSPARLRWKSCES
jgi:hypothetical protein